MTGFVLLDKGEGMTSFTAARRVGKIFETKKAGHTGTLDPMATGVMVIALGNATRFIELIADHDKAYRARLLLGKTTDTLDITGNVLEEKSVCVSEKQVRETAFLFKGEITQVPPMYSAIKKDGVRLYELARQGIEIEREERRVNISSLEITPLNEREYEIEVFCSKGTYIRTLISDIGESLGTGATMTSLRRIRANGATIDKCHSLEELEKMKAEGELSAALIPTEKFITYPEIYVTAPQAKRFSNGGALDINRIGGKRESGLYNVFSPEKKFLGIGEIDQEKTQLKVKRVFVG